MANSFFKKQIRNPLVRIELALVMLREMAILKCVLCCKPVVSVS